MIKWYKLWFGELTFYVMYALQMNLLHKHIKVIVTGSYRPRGRRSYYVVEGPASVITKNYRWNTLMIDYNNYDYWKR